MQDSLILITARGGSSRIKDKNIKLFGNKPLIAHIIEKALKSNCGRVVVSTDSEKIKKVALEYGAEVPFLRPPEFATKTANSLVPILHAIQWFKENENWEPKYLLFTPATSPFTSIKTIQENKQKLIEAPQYINSAITVCTPKTHPFSTIMLDGDNVKDGVVYINGQNNQNVVRSQDYPIMYELCACCTTTKVSFYNQLLNKANGDISKVEYIRIVDEQNCVANIIPQIESIDIDEPEDFDFAQKLLKLKEEE